MNAGSSNVAIPARRSLLAGLVLWAAGTAIIRFGGTLLLGPSARVSPMVLFAGSISLMGLLVPTLLAKLGVQRERMFEAAALLMLPTLLLDALTCARFGQVFPNLDPSAAGTFGGWMLICCGGAIVGVWWHDGA